MKNIAIISLGYLWFPCEPGPSRFYQIAQTFVNAGWNVECITTSFQHFQKKPRDKELILSQGYPFKVTFIEAPAYKKNVDLRRVHSNKVAAKNLKKYLEDHIDTYDAIYTSIPANNISAMVTTVAKEHGIPCVGDIEDLWPEAMSMVVKSGFLRKVLFNGFERDAETTYRNASGIVGTSEDYTERAFKNSKKDIPAETVYVGVNLADFDRGVEEHRGEIQKPEDEFWVTYAGSISTSYDIKTLIDAVVAIPNLSVSKTERTEGSKKKVELQILGTGSLKEELEEYSRNFPNVHFWGFTEYHKMAAVLFKSDIVVNSFVKGAPQSIVNKVGDYLASGKPMINTLENPVFCKLVEENGVGINVEPGNAEKLRSAIEELCQDEEKRKRLGTNARRLCEKRFDRAVSYKKIVGLTESLKK